MVQLEYLTGNFAYGGKEWGIPGRFMEPYMGKVYNGIKTSKGHLVSTEVISVAAEMFTSAGGMRKLYDHHPDLFTYIVGLSQV